jgi:hypothetical protein
MVIVLVLVAGALAAAVGFGLLLHDTATPVSIQDVVRRFREGGSGPGGLDGVYLYATRGGESVDALSGAHHRYPAKTSVTVVTVPCGVKLTWEPLEGRSATWTLCATGLGIELHAWAVAHRFFGQSDRTSYACSRTVLVPSGEATDGTSPFRCRSGRGRETGEVRVLGLQEVSVGGAQLRAVHVQTVATVKGGDHGTERTDWWLDERTGLPLRIALLNRTSRGFFLGNVHYREDADFRLVSTTPLR